MITLYKGDDTNGQLGKKCVVRFHCDDVVDMDGVTVKFNLLNVVTKEFENVHDGDELEVFVSHIDSRKLPLGIVYGKLWGEDSSGKIRTFANRIPFCVTTDLRKVYGSDGLDSVDVHVYASVDWDAVANKPTLFPSKVSMVEGLEEALAQAGKVKTVNGQSPDANGNIEIELPSCKVTSVNDKTGDVELTAQDIPVSPTNTDSIEDALGKKLSIDDIEQHKFPPESHSHESTEIKVEDGENELPLVVAPSSSAKTGQAADAKALWDKLKMFFNPNGEDQAVLARTPDGVAFGLYDPNKGSGILISTNGNIQTFGGKSILSGITAQDIADFLKQYKGTQYDYNYFHFDCNAGDWFIVIVNGESIAYVANKRIEAGEYWDLGSVYNASSGFKRLIDLFGESNSQMVATIREKVLADGEGEIKDSLFKDESFGGGSSSAPEGSLSKTVADIKASARPNITVVGSPTINGGSVSGFSANNYLVFPSTVDIGNATVDFDLTVQTGSQVATQENILDSWCGLALAIENGQWVLAVSTDGTTFANVGRGGTVTANTPYRLRISFSHTLEGGHIVTLRESDGEGGYGDLIISMALAAHIFPKPLYFGGANPISGAHHIFTGVINIGACSMNFNGTQVWNGWFGVVPPHKHKAEDVTDLPAKVTEEVANQAVGEIEAASGKLIVKDDGGNEQFNSEMAVRYALDESESTTLSDMTIKGLVTAVEQPTITLSTTSVDGRAIDCILDWTNNYEADATLQLTNLASVVLLGDTTEVFKLATGERALITFTQVTGETPTFVIAKKVVA